MEDLLLENCKLTIQITGRVSRDENGDIKNIFDLESIGTLDLSPLEVNEVEHEGLRLRFKEAVRLQPRLGLILQFCARPQPCTLESRVGGDVPIEQILGTGRAGVWRQRLVCELCLPGLVDALFLFGIRHALVFEELHEVARIGAAVGLGVNRDGFRIPRVLAILGSRESENPGKIGETIKSPAPRRRVQPEKCLETGDQTCGIPASSSVSKISGSRKRHQVCAISRPDDERRGKFLEAGS